MIYRIDLPEILKPIYFDFHWSQKKLWALDLSISQMKTSEFLWLLNYPIWATNPPLRIFDLEPIKVLENIDLYPDRKDRIDKADLSFPIHVMHWKNRWVIMDGFHRLLKTLLAKRDVVEVKIVPQHLITLITPDKNHPTGFLKYQSPV